MDLFFTIIITYLIGSIPTALVFSKLFFNKDIRELGSGNIGASNSIRTMGPYIGFLVLFIDILKGFLISTLSHKMGHGYLSVFSIIGHCFPFYLGFKGGKGVSVFSGHLLYLNPYLFLIFLISFLTNIISHKYASLSSIISSTIIVIISLFYNIDILTIFIFYVVIIYKHIENIERLLNKKEMRIFNR